MDSEEYLMLSGIQHFAFCKRQWALIHIEQLWEENWRTVGGRYLHRKVDDPYFSESRKNVIITRALPIVSHALRITGIADVVEFLQSNSGIVLDGKTGYWSVQPVEYKRGEKKNGDFDAVQLCAQALCLEEMYHTLIPFGYLFYGKTRHRETVTLDSHLRKRVKDIVTEMYEWFQSGKTPAATYHPHCKACSLINVCLPRLSEKATVNQYLDSYLGER